ncbi:CLUMA_CG012089, isoform A [Clunio marinus]|uniref:CLUMA_CG012089, isoform A n=1 Tax=Clunio marinus TaxID=568069 RepID=A0A1J1IET3_9DIPT|nr:CLUMA_CG012089, isoform A [Clunio marinus]
MIGYLPNIELKLYSCFYIILLVIILYNVQSISNSNLPDYNFMGKGWTFLNRKIDDYDVEWQTWKSFIRNYWYCFVMHSCVAEVFRVLKFKNISMLFFIIGSISCFIMYNTRFLLVVLLQTIISYIVTTMTKNKIHVWILASFWLIILNILKHESNIKIATDVLDIDESKIHDFLVIFAWCLLKNISFNLERCSGVYNKSDAKFKFSECLGYVFYFPTFFGGPHVIYKRYSDMLKGFNEILPSRERYQSFILNLLRFSFWFFLTELALHFFYVNSIVMNLDLKFLDSLSLFGVGYLMGQFFNNKYIIHYGVSITFGRLDGIDMPKPPKCICRVHKYSDMWKWFDSGLYEFLLKYIYISLCEKKSPMWRKIFAGFTTFLFIYIWHGFFDYILVWSLLNCVCIVLEKFVYFVIEGEGFERKALKIVKTENNLHRLQAIIGTHVLIPAIISNLFFFGGLEVGWEFVRRIYLEGVFTYIKISSCIYFLYPIAEAIKRWEISNKK